MMATTMISALRDMNDDQLNAQFVSQLTALDQTRSTAEQRERLLWTAWEIARRDTQAGASEAAVLMSLRELLLDTLSGAHELDLFLRAVSLTQLLVLLHEEQ